MATKKKPDVPETTLLHYRALLECFPDVPLKGAANPYTSLNGNMFSFIDKEGFLSLRMGNEDRLKFAEEFQTGPSIQYGAVMREYLLVPKNVLADLQQAKELFHISYQYAQTLPAKPTTRKKK